MQWQKSYRQPWTPYTGRGKGGSAHRAASSTPAVSMTRGGGTAAAISTLAAAQADNVDEGERHRSKWSRSETREQSRSPLRERRSCRHGGSRRSPSRSPPPRWTRHVDTYYNDQYMRNPMTSPTGPPFSTGRHTGVFRRTVVRPHPAIRINHTPPRSGTIFSRYRETGRHVQWLCIPVRQAPHSRDLG